MTTEYTRKEKEAINRAFSMMEYMTDCTDHNMAYILKEALRYERKQRSSIYPAKALLVSSFLSGMQSNPKASDLYGLADGCRNATILGAAMQDRWSDIIPGDFQSVAETCYNAHQQAIRRMIEKIN